MKRGKRLKEWRQSWRCWTHIKHFLCWRMPLRYRSCKLYWKHHPLTCVERSCAFSTGLFFYSIGRVANVSLEGNVCKQAGFPMSFGGLGCRKAGGLLSEFTIADRNVIQKDWMELVSTLSSSQGSANGIFSIQGFTFRENWNSISCKFQIFYQSFLLPRNGRLLIEYEFKEGGDIFF